MTQNPHSIWTQSQDGESLVGCLPIYLVNLGCLHCILSQVSKSSSTPRWSPCDECSDRAVEGTGGPGKDITEEITWRGSCRDFPGGQWEQR